MKKEIHECKYYKGVILDVSCRHGRYYCRSCGKELKDTQVSDKILKELKKGTKQK